MTTKKFIYITLDGRGFAVLRSSCMKIFKKFKKKMSLAKCCNFLANLPL